MELNFRLTGVGSGGRWRWRVSGNPWVVVLTIILLVAVGMSVAGACKYVRDRYGAYEGTVLAITTRWSDWMVFEWVDAEHLVIRTPPGRVIDRYVTTTQRLQANIRVGDYIVKQKGFGRPEIRPGVTEPVERERPAAGSGRNRGGEP